MSGIRTFEGLGTYYDAAKRAADDTALVEAMHAIKDEFEAYGWRRMQAALGQQGWVVNHKKLKAICPSHETVEEFNRGSCKCAASPRRLTPMRDAFCEWSDISATAGRRAADG